MKINILEAKNRLSELIQSVLAGEEIIIANRGNPVVKLVPVSNSECGSGGVRSTENIGAWLQKNPLPEHLQRSHDDIESSIDEQRQSWD